MFRISTLHIIRAIRIACLIVTSSTVVTMMTPNKTDDMVLGRILGILNILAGNFGQNVNLYDPQKGVPSNVNQDELKRLVQEIQKYEALTKDTEKGGGK